MMYDYKWPYYGINSKIIYDDSPKGGSAGVKVLKILALLKLCVCACGPTHAKIF